MPFFVPPPQIVVSTTLVESAPRGDGTTWVQETLFLDDNTQLHFEYYRDPLAISAADMLALRVQTININQPVVRVRERINQVQNDLIAATTVANQELIASFQASLLKVPTSGAVSLRVGSILVVGAYTWTCTDQKIYMSGGTITDVPDLGEFAPWPGKTGGILITGLNDTALLSNHNGIHGEIQLEFECQNASAVIKNVHMEFAGNVPGNGVLRMYGHTNDDPGFSYEDDFQLIQSNNTTRDGATLLTYSTPVETASAAIQVFATAVCDYAASVMTFVGLQPLT